MRRQVQFIIWGTILMATAVPVNGRTISTSEDPLIRIESDYDAGSISFDDWALLTATAIRKPEALPARYAVSAKADETVVATGREATMALVKISNNWSRLSPEAQLLVAAVLTRWSTAFTFDTPGGFFKIHYDTVGTHAVPKADVGGNGIPDYIDKCAAYLDSTATKRIASGFLMPPSDGGLGGDARYDVYFESMLYYGYAQPEAPGPAAWNDYTSHLVLHKTFLSFPPNSDPEGDQYGAMKATIGHEFQHSIQFGYDVSEYGWFMELDATYTEDAIFPLTHDNFNYLNTYFVSPHSSLMTENGAHEYSSFIWGKFLEQKFDTSLLRAIWEGARYGATVYTALSDTLLGRYGWTQDSAFAEFANWNFATGSRNDGLHHTDAANYPLAAMGATHNSFPVALQSPPNSPGGYAASYVQFQPVAVTGTLRIRFDGADTREWAAWVITSTAANVHQFQKISLAPGTYFGEVDIPDFQSYYRVTLVGVNLSEFSSAAAFQYSAEVASVFQVTSKIITSSMVYSGAPRLFEFEVNNNAPTGDVIRVTGSDTQGWVNFAPFDQFIAAGDSEIVTIAVTPPVGTPLSTATMLTFKATSRSDTTKSDTKSKGATTVLQIGDVDFDGGVDISDLTALIGHLYLGGAPPQPVPGSGNFDCDGGNDISDLSALIAYLYLSGPPCACRPF